MAGKKKAASPADIVRSLSREELESLVLGRLEVGEAALGNVIVARYAKADGGDARRLVHNLVEGHDEDGYGYVNDAEGLADELDELRRRASSLKGPGEASRAFAMLAAIVEEVGPRCWQGDDHDGVLVGLVRECLEAILALASRRVTAAECLGAIRSWAKENVDSRWAVEGDSWDFELIRIQLAAARGAEERRESLGLCLARCAPGTAENHDRYLAERCAQTILEALRFPRDAAERAAFIEGHLHLDKVREAAISEALAAKDFSRAESLAREGMEKAMRGQRRGTAEGYARRLVEVLDAAGRKEEAEAFIEANAIKEESLEWFKTLKKRIRDKAAWESVRERVIAAVAPRARDFHAAILAAEALVERLAELARARPSLMAVHYRQIGRRFPEEAARYLAASIRKELERTHSRGGYQFIAARVREYEKFAGKEGALALVEELCTLYPRRPAMIEELRRAVSSPRLPRPRR